MSIIVYDKFYFVNRGQYLELGNDTKNFHNGVLDEYVDSLVHVVIPSHVNNIPVKKLRYRCFLNCTKLTTCYIPRTVISLEGDTFYSTNISQVIFAEDINLISIQMWIFANAPIEYVTLPSSVKNIYYSIFDYARKLKVVYCLSPNPIFSKNLTVNSNFVVHLPKNSPLKHFGGITNIIKDLDPSPIVRSCQRNLYFRGNFNILPYVFIYLFD